MMRKNGFFFAVVLLGGLLFLPQTELAGMDEQALLRSFRQETNTLKRRKIFRELTGGKVVSEQALLLGIQDKDAVLQRYSLCLLSSRDMKKALGALQKLAATKDPVTLDLVYGCAMKIRDLHAQRALLRKIAANPLRTRSVLLAHSRVSFEFYRENKRLKDSNAYDHDVRTIRSVELPSRNWSFTTDKEKNGHRQGYFYDSMGIDDWKKVALGPWNKQGFPSYRGVAWYKVRFPMIKRMEHESVELFFRQVGTSAWVWLNEKYIGQDYSGSKNGFYLDVTNEIRWGQENELTVRVESTSPHGGILQKVCLEILK